MLFGKTIQFPELQARQSIAARLSAAVLPDASFTTLKPVRVNDWMARYRGRRFIGTFDGSRFKLVLLRAPGTSFRLRNSVVVIVGLIEDHSISIRLRPPLFIVVFLATFAVAVSAGLVLSFFAPLNLRIVQAAMALTLVLPFAIVGWFFGREAAEAEEALRQTVLGE